MTPQQLRERLADFAIAAARLTRPLLRDRAACHPATQLARCAASAAANYRAATLARSHAEFTSKIGTALEEADEAVFWLEHLRRAGMVSEEVVAPILQESLEMAAILGASKRTSLRNARLRGIRPKRGQRDG